MSAFCTVQTNIMSENVSYTVRHLDSVSSASTETEIYRTSKHWVVLFWPSVGAALIAIVGVPPLIGVFDTGGSVQGSVILAATAAVFFITAAVVVGLSFTKLKTTDVIVTNYHIILDAGILRAKTSFTQLGQVGRVSVRQGYLGRRLGYGAVTIHDCQGHARRIKTIREPLQLFEFIQCRLNRGANESAILRAD